MKIKAKQIKEETKCGGCNWDNNQFFKLNGWSKNDWLCGNCFSVELYNSEANYQIIPKRLLKK